ncbi:MAG: alpha-amylase [Lachnospiraceae bacterium]|nr:alpha-amylase [Lachnospiraceae bacterium]
MAWYDEAVFYHIYPLGLAGAPKENAYGEPVSRLRDLFPWIAHVKQIGCNAIYIGPLFESVGHGYETTDYKKLDSRLGTNEDLTEFVGKCHEMGVKVILDGVFNHTGRDFFAFQDVKKNREGSPYKDWFCHVNFGGNNEYNDGFSYENWGGYNLLVKLNQKNPAVKDYICDVVRFWASEFDIDGIRLDAADVLDFDYMQALRRVANEVKPDFWLMGEVIHGDYTRWANEGTLHSVTNYHLHKALYSGHNDHNYFEIAHTVKRLYALGGNRPDGLKLYNFVDNHDVERIYTKLNNKAHFMPVHILLYTLPGIPSVYYGSEFGIEGKKERFSDDSLRPALSLGDYEKAIEHNSFTRLIAALGKTRQHTKALSYGDYNELLLTNRQYAFSRNFGGESVLITVNNDESDFVMTLPAGNCAAYVGALSGEHVSVSGGHIVVNVAANGGEIWLPVREGQEMPEKEAVAAGPVELHVEDAVAEVAVERAVTEQAAMAAHEQKLCDTVAAQVEQTAAAPQTSAQAAQMGAAAPQTSAQAAQMGAAAPQTSAQAAETAAVAPQTAEQVVQMAAADRQMPEAAGQAEAFEKGRIAGLQEAILAIMEKNGPVTEQMRKDVMDNVYHDSLINWVKSFR